MENGPSIDCHHCHHVSGHAQHDEQRHLVVDLGTNCRDYLVVSAWLHSSLAAWGQGAAIMLVCYFGALRERLGIKSEEITDLSGCHTAGDILTKLSAKSERHHQAFSSIGNICVAVDQEHASLESPLDGAEEIAFFPPVTGG